MESGCHVPSLEELVRTAFIRRDLLMAAVCKWPRDGNQVLIMSKEFLGTSVLKKSVDIESFMSAHALGLPKASESWWVVSHGRWCPSYCYYYYDYYYYCCCCCCCTYCLLLAADFLLLHTITCSIWVTSYQRLLTTHYLVLPS